MKTPLGRWPFRRIVLAWIAWIVFLVVCFVTYNVLQIVIALRSSGSGGIGAVVGIVYWLALAIVFGPPLILTVIWLLRRRS